MDEQHTKLITSIKKFIETNKELVDELKNEPHDIKCICPLCKKWRMRYNKVIKTTAEYDVSKIDFAGEK